MDSNETIRPLTEVPVEQTSETLVSSSATAEENNATYVPKQTKEEVIERLKEINEDACNADKQELDLLKQNFYKLHKAEQEAARKAFIDGGGAPEAFIPQPDDAESRFKDIMSSIKEKRSAIQAEQDKEKEDNLVKKLAIIDRLKELAESPEDANKAYNEFKKLQQEWNDIKQVPAAKVNELWKNYQHYAEKFYDLIKLNNEFREYDFKKNLEIKTHLCEAAEKLADEEDVISAFHQLQKLHQEFRNTGPVAKELREDIWTRFKTASTAVNRRHQQHFEALKEKEQRNLDEKTVICEIVEAMEYDTFTTFQDWENKTQEIIALQAKWKTIGYAPQKMNVKIFERFRAACDEFFKRKAEFFKSIKESMAGNLEKKKALCEKAEALKESTDWKATADILSKLQKEWKTIGPVPKKYSDAVWKRFIAACDYFFEQKNKATSSQRSVEQENMVQKKAIIEKLNAIDAQETALCEKAEALKESTDWKATADILSKLQKEWKTIGPVPKKYSDAVWKRFIAACDYFFEQKNKATSSQRSVEQENMVQKKAIIEKLNAIDAQETPEEDAGNAIRELMKEWNGIGHVPFKEKDKLYKQYHGVIDKLFDKLNLSASQKKLSNFKSTISKEGNLYREREKLVRAYENMKNEIQTYENNLGFLTSSSKKGSSLVTEMNRKVEKLKADLELILKKIEVIDQSMKNE